MMSFPIPWIAFLVFLAALFPSFTSAYQLSFLFNLFLNLNLALGMNLLWGFAGYLNLGYTAFFGLGGYVTAWVLLHGWPISFCLPVSLMLVLPLTAILGWILFRLTGLYFSAASLGLLILLEETAGKWSTLTGGHEGLALPLSPKGFVPYWVLLALTVASLTAQVYFDRGKWGFQLRMIREDEKLAESVGVPVFWVKVTGYLFGAAIAVLAGGIQTWQVGYISPASAFGMSTAVPPVIMALIGGGRKWWGPVLAALFISLLQEWLWTGGGRWVLFGYGLVLIFVGMFWIGMKKEGCRKTLHIERFIFFVE